MITRTHEPAGIVTLPADEDHPAKGKTDDDAAHGAASPMTSSAAPRGVDGRPTESRSTARRSTSSGQPNCSARLAATAESRALASLCEPGLWFCRKISAGRPSAKCETLAV